MAHFRSLRRTFRTPLVILLDNLNLHKGKDLRAWLESVLDVHLEFLPPYAPELNPAEGVWGHGKCVTAAGRLVDDCAQLKSLAREAVIVNFMTLEKLSKLRFLVRKRGQDLFVVIRQ